MFATPVLVAAAAAELADEAALESEADAPVAEIDVAEEEEEVEEVTLLSVLVLEPEPELELAVAVPLDAVEAQVADWGRFVTPAPVQRLVANWMVPVLSRNKKQQ